MSMQNLQEKADEVRAHLPRTTFTFPEGARALGDPKKVTIRQLTSGEEEAALIAANKKGIGFEYEGAKRALVAVDGKPLSWENNGVEEAFLGMSNKVRDLVIRGFAMVALPSKGEADDFLASAKTEA